MSGETANCAQMAHPKARDPTKSARMARLRLHPQRQRSRHWS
jgi:hypothetical protein